MLLGWASVAELSSQLELLDGLLRGSAACVRASRIAHHIRKGLVLLNTDFEVASLSGHDQRSLISKILQVLDHKLLATRVALNDLDVMPLLAVVDERCIEPAIAIFSEVLELAKVMLTTMVFILSSQVLVVLRDVLGLPQSLLLLCCNLLQRLITGASLSQRVRESLVLLVAAEVVSLRVTMGVALANLWR